MHPISNFHTHTYLCHHAKGKPVEFVEQAMKDGCTALGFSDHCPYPDSMFDPWPNIRMTLEEVETYKEEIEEAREISSFPVYMGFECEWESDFSEWYDELKEKYGAQYLVLGSHWVTEGDSHIYAQHFDSPSILNKYIDQTIDGMRSGKFSFLAHPDLFMMNGRTWDEQTKACSQAIIDAAVDLELPIEINGVGISRPPINTSRGMRYQYPYNEFWEMAALTNVKVICNSDAHNPQDVIHNAWKTRDFALRFGIEPIDGVF